jgi:hypothetical protein
LRSSSLPLKSKTPITIAAGLTKQMLIYVLTQLALTPKYGDHAYRKFHARGASDHG